MTGPRNADPEPLKGGVKGHLDSMDSVHPLAPSGASANSPTTIKKPSSGKGVPIEVPTNHRRLSNFSAKTANRALMTGYRDGGSGNGRRKSSASSQGHQSPPFVAYKDDYDVIGTLPGFEKLVEAESSKQGKGKLRVVEPIPLEEDEISEHKPVKRKRVIKEDVDLEELGSKPAPSKSRAWRVWPQFPLSCVRIEPSTEFSSVGLSVQFGVDRLALTIRRKCTKIPYSKLQLVEYYTASAVRIIRLSINGKLEESSFLAPYYNSTPGVAHRIILLTDAAPSLILDICEHLKQKAIETTSLTSEAAERLLAGNNKRAPSTALSDHAEETLFVYPLNNTAKSKSIAVRAEDVSRLDDGEFLNDTLIEFGLKYAHANVELKNAALADQIYVFNTFFYQRLNTKPTKGAASSYDAVKSWTAKVDLFAMKYIIVPVHENLHWYLAIITNPGLLLKHGHPTPCDPEVLGDEPVQLSCEAEVKSPSPTTAESMDVDTEVHNTKVKDLDADVDSNKSEGVLKAKTTLQKPGSHIDAEEKTYILCLDSLGGTHQAVFKVLRSFLQHELLTRKGIDKPLTTKEVTGKYSSKCPRQENLWDCGVYLLHYAEVFMRNPSMLLDAVVNRADEKTMWASTELATKREKYRDIMVSLQERYKAYRTSLGFIEDFKEQSKENKHKEDPEADRPEEHGQSGLEVDNSNRALKLMLQRWRPAHRTGSSPSSPSLSSSLSKHAALSHSPQATAVEPFDPVKARSQLVSYFRALKEAQATLATHANPSDDVDERQLQRLRQTISHKELGFHLEVAPSQIPSAGLGLFLRNGRISTPGTIIAMYPGTLYRPGEAIFFNSIQNRYILKCNDGVYVDGKAKGLSGSIYRSIDKRDNYPGTVPSADKTWMIDWPSALTTAASASATGSSVPETTQHIVGISTAVLRNPLAAGQIVNNGTRAFPPNVRYQELDLRTRDCALELQEFLPNIWYSDDWHAHDHDHDHDDSERARKEGEEAEADTNDGAQKQQVDWSQRSLSDLDHLRTVVLVTTRPIAQDEELYSTYIE
ncbi:hypothetical protein BGZ68_010780 [Mortierella alpina]|nr:hypothetical protein BGZ68_010780 [Mortierella alpina]